MDAVIFLIRLGGLLVDSAAKRSILLTLVLLGCGHSLYCRIANCVSQPTICGLLHPRQVGSIMPNGRSQDCQTCFASCSPPGHEHA